MMHEPGAEVAMMPDEVAVATAQAGAVDWDAAEREGRRAAALVALFVGVPALIAAGATLLLFALVWLVLLAPLVAVVLTWTAWRYGKPEASPGAGRPPRAGPPSR